MGDLAAIVANRNEAQRVAEHGAVLAIVAQRDRTMPALCQCCPYLGYFWLESVASLKVATVLSDCLGRDIAGDRLECAIHVDDGLAPHPHVRNKDAIATMFKRERRSDWRNDRSARPPAREQPP